MIEIFGALVSPFVVKLLSAAGYKGLEYRHQEFVSIRALRSLNPSASHHCAECKVHSSATAVTCQTFVAPTGR